MKASTSIRNLVAAVSIGVGQLAYGSGFPVVDIASISQAVTDYTNQLLHYEELMAQTILNESQLMEAIQLYEQVMTEYDHMLYQMEGLRDKVSQREWEQIYARYKHVIDSHPTARPDYNTPRWTAANRKLEEVYTRSGRLEDIEDALGAVSFDPASLDYATQATRQGYAREQLATAQQLFVEDVSVEMGEQMIRAGKVSDSRMSLGPEDHLRTLQVMVEQNELLLDAIYQQNAINNAQLQYANQLDAQIFAEQNVGRQATLNEVRARQSQLTLVDESPLVNF